MSKKTRNIEEYMRTHTVTPLCECGCGVRVGFNSEGRINKYAGKGHQTRRNRDRYSQMATEQRAKQREANGNIPLDDFIAAIRKYKKTEKVTWAEIAERGGISKGYLDVLIYKKGSAKSVGREWTTNFFKRLAGLPAPPSQYQLRQMKETAVALRETNIVF